MEIKELSAQEIYNLKLEEAIILGPKIYVRWHSFHGRPYHFINLHEALEVERLKAKHWPLREKLNSEEYNEEKKLRWHETLEEIKIIGIEKYTKRMIWRSYPPIIDLNFEECLLSLFKNVPSDVADFKERNASIMESLKEAYKENLTRATVGSKLFGNVPLEPEDTLETLWK